MAAKVISREAAVGPEALIGAKGIIATLSPDEYVRVGTELRRACPIIGDIDVGAEVVISGIDRLTLLVKKPSNSSMMTALQYHVIIEQRNN